MKVLLGLFASVLNLVLAVVVGISQFAIALVGVVVGLVALLPILVVIGFFFWAVVILL